MYDLVVVIWRKQFIQDGEGQSQNTVLSRHQQLNGLSNVIS